MMRCPILFPSPLQVAYQSARSSAIATRRQVCRVRTEHARHAPGPPGTRLVVLEDPSDDRSATPYRPSRVNPPAGPG